MSDKRADDLLHQIAMRLSSGQSITPNDFLQDQINEYLSEKAKKEEEYTFEKQVLAHVEDHSGGVKLIELISEMAANAKDNGVEIEELGSRIMKTVKESEYLEALEYTYKTLGRGKFFIYTP